MPEIELREYSHDLGMSLKDFTTDALVNNAISPENACRLVLFGENILSQVLLDSLDEINDQAETFTCVAPQPVAAALRVVHDFYPDEEVRFKPRLGASWLKRLVWACEEPGQDIEDRMQNAAKDALACIIGKDEIEVKHPRGLVVLSNPKDKKVLTMATPNWPGLIISDWHRFIYNRASLGSGIHDPINYAIRFNFELSLYESACENIYFYTSIFTNYRQLGIAPRIPNPKHKFDTSNSD